MTERPTTVASDTATVIDAAPRLTGNISTTATMGSAAYFSRALFASVFSDRDSADSLQEVQITTLPTRGMLILNGTVVTLNQEIPVGQLRFLTYVPTIKGSDSFRWNASDGMLYAATSVAANITTNTVKPTSVLMYSSTPTIHGGESVDISVLVAVPAGGVAATGTVTLRDETGATLKTATLADGQADCLVSGLKRGSHQISVSYSGDAVYNAMSGSQKLSVQVVADNVVDILALYTASAAQKAGNISAAIDKAVADANQALLNSQIDLTFRVVDVAETNYAESGTYSTDLARLQSPDDEYMDEAWKLRVAYGADAVCLFVGSAQSDGTIGLSYQLKDITDQDDVARAFSVVDIATASAPNYTLAHELGHVLGAAHDQQQNSGPGAFSDSYGYRFTGNDGVQYRDIMAYAPGKQIPYYSNPNVLYAGVPTGQAGVANAAGTINTTAPLVAGYMPTEVPLVTQSGVSLVLPRLSVAGQTTKLKATVTGLAANSQIPSGTVTFMDGNTVLGSGTVLGGVAKWWGTLPAGAHSIRALYQGDRYFGAALSGEASLTAYGAALEPDRTLVVTGSPGNDTITVTQANGNCTVNFNGVVSTYAASGVSAVEVDANDGNDTVLISGMRKATSVYGGAGGDTITIAPDVLAGVFLSGGSGNDTLYGGAGNDSIYGGAGNDLIFGAGGADYIEGGGGSDTIFGGAGADTIYGGAGNNLVYGGAGNDLIGVNDGSVTSFHDTVIAGPGVDTVDADVLDTVVGAEVLA